MTSVILYNNSSDTRYVNKVLNNPVEVEGEYKQIQSLLNGTLTLRLAVGILDKNYAKIDKNYYYIDNPQYLRTDLIRYDLRLDVLMSCKEQFLELTGVIKRNSVNYNSYFHDNELSSYAYKGIQTQLFSNSNVFDGNSYVLVTV